MTKTILTVDDSPTMRDMLRSCLTGADFNVVTAEDGADGLDKLRESQPDVVITDINMPVMDGFEFIENVRQSEDASRMPILVLTTESHQDMKMRAKNAGATGWIAKPFVPEKLIDALKRVLP